MKMCDAMKIINEKSKGYMVSFEWKERGFLRSDHFPDKGAGEELIKTESEAWELAEKFAEKTKGRSVNLFVMKWAYSPVSGYRGKIIKNR